MYFSNILVRYQGWGHHRNFDHPDIVVDKKAIDEKKDVVSKDSKPREKQVRKQVSAKSSKGSDSNTPPSPKNPKKAKSTPQQNSNPRTA